VKNIKKQYQKVCEAYVEAFCNKQDLLFDGWIGNDVGTIALISDFYFDFDDIRTDIDTNQPAELITEWYYRNLDNQKYINYKSYIAGFRDYNKLHAATGRAKV